MVSILAICAAFSEKTVDFDSELVKLKSIREVEGFGGIV